MSAGDRVRPRRLPTAQHHELIRQAFLAFRADAALPPPLTLRGGHVMDTGGPPPPFHAGLDAPTDRYLEAHVQAALPHLDDASYRHYLPHLITYALLHAREGGASVVEALLGSLHPAVHDPPRHTALSRLQQANVTALLEVLGFSEDSAYQKITVRLLQEHWRPATRAQHP